MEGNSGENDLRASSAPQPRSGPAQPSHYPPTGGWEQPQQSEVIEDRGITGYRAIAKIVDYFVINVVTSVISTPIYFIWFFSNINRFETLSEETDPDVFPLDFFVSFFIIWGALFFLIFVLTVAYYFILESKFQQTVGKKAFDLKVIHVRNGRANNAQLLARAILYVFSMFTYFWVVELIVAAVREDGRSVTDLICGTTVIRIKKIYYQTGAGAR